MKKLKKLFRLLFLILFLLMALAGGAMAILPRRPDHDNDNEIKTELVEGSENDLGIRD
ncbi:MAG: hypothetical protein HY015_06225 [Bacteroidetes bacterium]|nr:hypothetical protein [Bacteroidota bacterium]MBI3482559.1 hypothetical protein [Bacteroidota bacterium]